MSAFAIVCMAGLQCVAFLRHTQVLTKQALSPTVVMPSNV